MFLFQYPCRQGGGCIVWSYGYPCLQYNRAAIDGLGHKVDAGPVLPAPGLKRPLVSMQTGEIRQQGRVNVQHAPLVMMYKTGRQDTHEACQYYQCRLEAVNTFL